MTGNRDRDLDSIIAFGSKFDTFCDNIRKVAKCLESDAGSASSVLQDEISRKNIDEIYNLATNLKNIVDRGEEPVKELVLKARHTKSQLEELKGMSR